MPVHDIYVDIISPGPGDLGNLLTKAGKISGKN
jgi:hypothetical protein